MRTTLNIDEQLYRKVKVRAAIENRTITELVETALRRLLEGASNEAVNEGLKKPKAIGFPTIQTHKLQGVRRRAVTIDEMEQRVKEAELESDIDRHEEAFGH